MCAKVFYVKTTLNMLREFALRYSMKQNKDNEINISVSNQTIVQNNNNNKNNNIFLTL